MIRKIPNFALDLWESGYLDELQKLWQEGLFTKRFTFQTTEEKKSLLNAQLDEHWKTSRQLAELTNMSFRSTDKLLFSMAQMGEISISEQSWVDQRFRKRKRYLYRKSDVMRDSSMLLAKLLGIHAPPEKMVFTGYVVRHLMEDGEK